MDGRVGVPIGDKKDPHRQVAAFRVVAGRMGDEKVIAAFEATLRELIKRSAKAPREAKRTRARAKPRADGELN